MNITAKELLDKGVWHEACDMLGISLWAVNEGQIDEDDELSLTLKEAQELGLVDPTGDQG